MFSENDRISSRQTKYLVMMEITAKCCILLPVLLAGKNTGSIVVCIVLGIWLWCFVLKRILKWMEPGGDFFDSLVRMGGTGTAVLIYFAGFWYFLAHSAVFLNLCGELAHTYLLPDVPVPVLCLLPFFAALCFGLGSVEIRGRFCEVTGPVLAVLSVLLIFLAGFGMEAYQYEETVIRREDFIFRGSFEVFAALGGMFLPLLAAHLTEKEFRPAFGRAVRRGGCMGMVTAGCLCVVTAASYGKTGMGEVPFSSVRVMSNVHLPGGFLRRWDIIFLSVLMFGLAVTVGGSFWYLKEILFRFQEEISLRQERISRQNEGDGGWISRWNGKKVMTVLWLLSALLSYFAASGFLGADTAIACYRAYNIQILIPVLTLFYIASGFRKRKKCEKIPAVLALLLLCGLTLCGCTAREPEERLFPVALEVGVTGNHEKEILLTCAWDKENNSEVLTGFRGASMEEIENRMEEYTERYIDFSHVKALILDEDLKAETQLYDEVIRWLMEDPAFASGLTVYPSSESGLRLSGVQEKADTDAGTYLEMLYRSREKYRDTSTTLGKVIAEYCAKSIL